MYTTEEIAARMGKERGDLFRKFADIVYDHELEQRLDDVHTSLINADDNDRFDAYYDILKAYQELKETVMNFYAEKHVRALEELGFECTLTPKKLN